MNKFEVLGSNNEPSGEVMEPKKRAEKIILETLGGDPGAGLDDFPGKLGGAIKSLPRYQELETSLAEVPNNHLVYDLFKAIKKSADKSLINENESQNLPVDGVLIKSMRRGNLECAGRVGIASTFLSERGIEHFVASGVGHAFIVAEVGPETLAYFDANDELYFTFPKSALSGYSESGESAICKIVEYIPDGKGLIDGVGAVQEEFIIIPPAKGVARQYLNNVAAALGGGKEFEKSGIPADDEAKMAIREITGEILGADKVWDEFHDSTKFSWLTKSYESHLRVMQEEMKAMIEAHPDKDGFVAAVESYLKDSKAKELFVYLSNASEEIKRKSAEKIYETLTRS